MTLAAGVGATFAGVSLLDCGTWPQVTTLPSPRTGAWCCRTGRGRTPVRQPSALEPLRQGHTDTTIQTHMWRCMRVTVCCSSRWHVSHEISAYFIDKPHRRQHYKRSPLNHYTWTTLCPWTVKWPFFKDIENYKNYWTSETYVIEVNLAELADSNWTHHLDISIHVKLIFQIWTVIVSQLVTLQM